MKTPYPLAMAWYLCHCQATSQTSPRRSCLVQHPYLHHLRQSHVFYFLIYDGPFSSFWTLISFCLSSSSLNFLNFISKVISAQALSIYFLLILLIYFNFFQVFLSISQVILPFNAFLNQQKEFLGASLSLLTLQQFSSFSILEIHQPKRHIILILLQIPLLQLIFYEVKLPFQQQVSSLFLNVLQKYFQ